MRTATISPYAFPGLTVFKTQKDYNIQDVKRLVAKSFDLSVEQLSEVSRKRQIVFARNLAMYILFTKKMLNKNRIAKEFNKDRTTVFHAVKMVENELFCKSEFASMAATVIGSFATQETACN